MSSGTVILVRSRESAPVQARAIAVVAVAASFVFVPLLVLKISGAARATGTPAAPANAVAKPHAAASRVARAAHKPAVAAYPAPSAVATASNYLVARSGETSFAVLDSTGRLSGYHVHRTFTSASITKA